MLTIEQQQELKLKWLEALRSGHYKQGQFALQKQREKGNEFCCLGVLCDLVDPHKWKEPCDDAVCCYTYDQELETSLPPKELIDAIGMSEDVVDRLTAMNDEMNYSFQTIANWLEQTFSNPGFGP